MKTNFHRYLALIYLVPIAIVHLALNTDATGIMAHFTSLLFGVTLFMIAFTALPWIAEPLGIDTVKTKPFEWMFNAALLAFAAITCLQMMNINASSTGFASMFALIWEWLSIFVGAIAFIAFWTVKGETVKHMLADDGDAKKAPAEKTPRHS